MAYDNTLREGYGDGTSSIVSSMPRTTSINGEVTDHHNISNNVSNDASSKPNLNPSQQKVRMVQFQRNTAEPLVSFSEGCISCLFFNLFYSCLNSFIH